MTNVDEFLDDDATKARRAPRQVVENLAALLTNKGIDVSDIAKINRVNAYQGFYKDAEGNAHTVDMVGIQLTPQWADGPKWPLIQPGPKVKRPPIQVKDVPIGKDWWQAFIMPDAQVGFYRDANGLLVPTHDTAAIDVSLAICKTVNPEVVVWLGDMIDLPEMSRYRLLPSFVQTTQPSINELTLMAERQRYAAPNAHSLIYIPGNHEDRFLNYVLDNSKAAFGLKQGKATPESWPVLSIPNLAHLDDVGFTYLQGYPNAEYAFNAGIRAVHGWKAQQGSTGHAYLASEHWSTIYGHVHRREMAWRTFNTGKGPIEVLMASPGTVARTDGPVPSTHQGKDQEGRPVGKPENWQQGCAVLTYNPEGTEFFYEPVTILNGRAMFRGRLYEAEAA